MLVSSVCWSPHTSMTTRVQTCIYICTPHAHSQKRKKYRGASSRVDFSFCFLVPREDSVGGHLGVRETATPSFRLAAWRLSDLVKTLLLGPHSQWCSSFGQLTDTPGFPCPEIPYALEAQCATLPSFPPFSLFPPSPLSLPTSGPLFWEPRWSVYTQCRTGLQHLRLPTWKGSSGSFSLTEHLAKLSS